jgi:hypothetical protein
MHAELGQAMPMGAREQQAHDFAIVWFWEKTIERWDSTLLILAE